MSIQDLKTWIKTLLTQHSLGDNAIKVKADISSISAVNIAKETGGNLATAVTSLGTIDTKLGTILTSNANIDTDTTNIYNNVLSKIERIKGASNYSRAFTYAAAYGAAGGENITVIVHTGTTAIGAETVTETITYSNPLIDGHQITSIVYS